MEEWKNGNSSVHFTRENKSLLAIWMEDCSKEEFNSSRETPANPRLYFAWSDRCQAVVRQMSGRLFVRCWIPNEYPTPNTTFSRCSLTVRQVFGMFLPNSFPNDYRYCGQQRYRYGLLDRRCALSLQFLQASTFAVPAVAMEKVSPGDWRRNACRRCWRWWHR